MNHFSKEAVGKDVALEDPATKKSPAECEAFAVIDLTFLLLNNILCSWSFGPTAESKGDLPPFLLKSINLPRLFPALPWVFLSDTPV